MILCTAQSLLELSVMSLCIEHGQSSNCTFTKSPSRLSKLKYLTIQEAEIAPCCLLVILNRLPDLHKLYFRSWSDEWRPYQQHFALIGKEWLTRSSMYMITGVAFFEDTLTVVSNWELSDYLRSHWKINSTDIIPLCRSRHSLLHLYERRPTNE